MNAEGDTSISEETLEGLGRKTFLSALFGIIIRIAAPPKVLRPTPDNQQSEVEVTAESKVVLDDHMYESKVTPGMVVDRIDSLSTRSPEKDLDEAELTDDTSSDFDTEQKKSLLRDLLPDPG